MAVNPRLLEILVCPICKGPLELDASRHALICKIDQLAYPIKDDIPVMLPNEATPLSELSITEPYQGDP
jgi:uncharacterized protein YbaR (Trm112 family)